MAEMFQIVVLGCTGGPRENNLSGYLISPLKQEEWLALDAGSLLGGIDLALEYKSLSSVTLKDSKLTPAGEMLVHRIKGYLISHAHLDHIAGLVLNSQIDENKAILGIKPTIDNIRDHIFNGRIWPNYGSEGSEPILHKYQYMRLSLHVPVPIPDTSMAVEPYLLSHPHGYPSTAFLINFEESYFLYFGDTSSDLFEGEKHLNRVWQRIAPLIQEKKLHCIMLECSYPHVFADQVIYGHLDTHLMMHELHQLAEIAKCSLEGLKVIVTHRKESMMRGPDTKELIREELMAMNDLGVDFLFPCQGERLMV